MLYEQLRRRVLEGGRGGPGYALLQREGMKSWMQACPRRKALPVRVCAPRQMVATSIAFCDELAQLIAVMVIEIHQRGAVS